MIFIFWYLEKYQIPASNSDLYLDPRNRDADHWFNNSYIIESTRVYFIFSKRYHFNFFYFLDSDLSGLTKFTK